MAKTPIAPWLSEGGKVTDFKRRSVTDLQYARHIRNIYKVLLTRGMVGTVIYAVDPETQDLLAGLLKSEADAEPS